MSTVQRSHYALCSAINGLVFKPKKINLFLMEYWRGGDSLLEALF
jgi:hypothetical protein